MEWCEEQLEVWRKGDHMEAPDDPRLLSPLIDFLPWVVEPKVTELHPHTVRLAAGPGASFSLEENDRLVESVLHAAVVAHVQEMNSSIGKRFYYIRQVCLLSVTMG